jgi:hypothetical protein
LNTSPLGRKIIQMYYLWSPILVKVMQEDETFKEQLKETVDKILQVIDSK